MTFTLFTTCRAFDENYGYPQESALESWTHLKPRPEIVLVGDEGGSEEAARKLNAIYVPDVERSDFGTPYLGSLFDQAQKAATNELLAYCNSDTLITQSFADAFLATAEQLPGKFLMTGVRWALRHCVWEADYSGDWEARLRTFTCGDGSVDMKGSGRQSKPTGIDFFAYRRDTYNKPEAFPPLVIGRAFWDPWLVWRALKNGADVVDAARAVFVVHQYHSRLKENSRKEGARVERKRNRGLAKKKRQMAYLWDATYRLTPMLKLEEASWYWQTPEYGPRELWAQDVNWKWK